MDNNINIKIKNVVKPDNNYITTIDNIKFQKMTFLYNAINDGWSVKKKKNSYTFKKNHEGKKEVFEEDYLLTFMKSNFDINNLLSHKD